MNDEIVILKEQDQVIVSPQIVKKLKYLIKENTTMTILEFDFKVERKMDLGVFYEIIEHIIQASRNRREILPSRDNMYSNIDFIYNLAQRFDELLPEEKKIYSIPQVKSVRLTEIIDIIYRLYKEINQFYLLHDLVNAKQDCLENMKYFLDKDTISLFSSAYEEAIKEKNIDRMKEMLEKVQQRILEEWEKYFQNLDEMTDENFTFIGHSTHSTKFSEPFYGHYVSSTLFTQDLTDTYNSGYGFILKPTNIVGANSKDMAVNNYAQSEEEMLHYTAIKKIDHPQRLIDECLKLKHKNSKKNCAKEVYSEVIIKGFEPIGIFCFTDGSKSLNKNRKCAEQLQQSFPNLKIRSFDIMKRKKGIELDEMKLVLLNRLQEQFTSRTFEINMESLYQYDFFFLEYERLKKRGDYDEVEIEVLFKQNLQLLSIFEKEPEELFSGKYSDEQIKYILGKNVNYSIEYIFMAKARAFLLNRLKDLEPYKDKINSMYDGFSMFIELSTRIEITEEMMEEINKKTPLNFYTISKHIASKMVQPLREREVQTRKDLNKFQMQYKELVQELGKREKMQEQYEYYNSIKLNIPFSGIIKEDYKNVMHDIQDNENKEHELEEKIYGIIKQIEEFRQTENIILDLRVFNGGIVNYQQTIIEIDNRLKKLSKHPFLNRRKIKQVKEEKNKVEQKQEAQNEQFETKRKNKIISIHSNIEKLEKEKSHLELNLEMVKWDLQNLQEEFHLLKRKIQDYFKCHSVEEIDVTILKTESFLETYDPMNSFYLMQVKEKIKRIDDYVLKQKNDLINIQQDLSVVSKVI